MSNIAAQHDYIISLCSNEKSAGIVGSVLDAILDDCDEEELTLEDLYDLIEAHITDAFHGESVDRPVNPGSTKSEVLKIIEEKYRPIKEAIGILIQFFPAHLGEEISEKLFEVVEKEFGNDLEAASFAVDSSTAEDQEIVESTEQGIQTTPPPINPNSDTPESEPPPLPCTDHLQPEEVSTNKETDERIHKKIRQFWNHLTISRDETSANDFDRGVLLALLSPVRKPESKPEQHTENHLTEPANQEPRVQQQIHLTEKELALKRKELALKHQYLQLQQYQALNQHQLEQQKSRLHSIRQNMPAKLSSETDPDVQSEVDTRMIQLASHEDPRSKNSNSADYPIGSGSNCDKNDKILPDADKYHQLLDRISSLETENTKLKNAPEGDGVDGGYILYFLQSADNKGSTCYVDEPTWSLGPRREAILVSRFPINDINGFLQQKPGIEFLVLKHYSQQFEQEEVQSATQAGRPPPRPQPYTEAIRFYSGEMIAAAEEFFARQPTFNDDFPGLNIKNPIPAPFLFWYKYRSPNAFEGLDDAHRTLMRLVTDWIEKNYGERYALVDRHLKAGLVSEKTIPFLVRPGDMMVWETGNSVHAAIAQSWPWIASPVLKRRKQGAEDKWDTQADSAIKETLKWSVKCWRYKYDGQFLRHTQTITMDLVTGSLEEVVKVTSLGSYPLQYAPERYKKILLSRGRTFWSCRHNKHVSYQDKRNTSMSGDRYMVDFQTYQKVHSDSKNFQYTYSTIGKVDSDRISDEIMANDNPPSAPDIYVFPNTIPGYDLRSKKWIDLDVDLIRDISWNKKSFDHLVADDDTKELIQALVNRQIASERGTDIIERKGNGLIILLHGGPGTGKTFTAETVAELAEKPLFRVTCGDIGTQPEQVEKYLDSVLHLGKKWGCVVLIDEAEVFLEQRSLDNLERNALVSVFLRVLEYYEGILILTSNRVGTFDEAFKSRILLSLHYENLTEGQRTKVWKGFFARLKDIEKEQGLPILQDNEISGSNQAQKRKAEDDIDEIDFEDVECYINELAKHELNGRQIRNAITTARQLATFRRQPMTYQHLKHVISVSGKFDRYLKTVQEGLTDDQIARGEGLR